MTVLSESNPVKPLALVPGKRGLGLGAKWSSRVFLSLRRCLAVSLYQFQEISQISLKLFRESLLFLSVMPNEKRARQEACLSSEDERTPPHKHEAGAAILESIHEKLKKLDVLEQINGRLLKIENTVGDMERGLNSMTAELQKVKTDLDSKADNATVDALKDEIEELQNRSRRNNLVFYNIPEKAEKGDCISFVQDFITQHMGLETICGHVELERAHRTPSKTPSAGEKGPRPMHVAFLRYTDKMKVLRNAAARLKDNPLNGNAIGISEDFAKKTQRRRQELVPYRKFLKKKLGDDRKVYIAYPAILKYVDANGRHRIVGTEELAKLRHEMEEAKS